MLDFKQSYFTLFGLAESFNIDSAKLATAFRELQAQYHPDRFVNADEQERRLAVQSTGFINEAHDALKSDRLRARYLLTLQGIEFDDEIDTTSDGMFLMQQIEFREALDDAKNSNDDTEAALDAVDKVGAEIKALHQQLNTDFVMHYDSQDYASAKESVLKMKFFERLNNEVKAISEKLEDEMF